MGLARRKIEARTILYPREAGHGLRGLFLGRLYPRDLPQQLPGPAHPAAAGDEPQHAVSPGPGIFPERTPESEDVAERSLLTLVLPQVLQAALSPDERTRISEDFPQSRHR
jgi:hypothetical protein